MVSLSAEHREIIKHRTAFVRRTTKEDLALWIAEYIGLEFPDVVVDPESKVSPMGFIWEVYSKVMDNRDPEVNRILAYASRDSGKTLAAAVLEFLMIVHFDRNAGHMAATLDQSAKATTYVGKFFSRPYFSRFVVGDNKKIKEFVRYEHRETAENITEKQWAALPPIQQVRYEEHRSKLEIVVCTPKGANSLHVPYFTTDEVDLANPQAYEEAKMIPTADAKGHAALTVLTSTRKYAFGLVQKEIDDSQKTGLRILHWNILDIARRCPPERHLPDEEKVRVLVDHENIRVYSGPEIDRLTEDQKAECADEQAFSGCLKNCSLYAVCRGRLATVQQNPKYPQASSIHKPIEHLISQFRNVDAEVAKAQLLCRKPSMSGLIYPFLDREVHMKSPKQIADMVVGEDIHPETFTKEDLVAFFKSREAQFVTGMDFGYTHNFVAITVAVDGRRAFVIDAVAQSEILTNQQIALCNAKLGRYASEVYADPENPQGIKEFKDAGWNMRKWSKGPGSVLTGIEIVRWMIRPLIGEPLLYFLSDDSIVDWVFGCLSKYHWTVDAAGNPTNVPDEADDDACDALRYGLMNRFRKGKTTVLAPEVDKSHGARSPAVTDVHRQQIADHVGVNLSLDPTKPVRKGRFFMSLG